MERVSTQQDRKTLYGSTMTAKETLKHLARSYPQMQFVERRTFPQPFRSATGTTRGKTALVFRQGEVEMLFTQGEVDQLGELGITITAKIEKTKARKAGLGGMF